MYKNYWIFRRNTVLRLLKPVDLAKKVEWARIIPLNSPKWVAARTYETEYTEERNHSLLMKI